MSSATAAPDFLKRGHSTLQARPWEGIENRGFNQIHFSVQMLQITCEFVSAEKKSVFKKGKNWPSSSVTQLGSNSNCTACAAIVCKDNFPAAYKIYKAISISYKAISISVNTLSIRFPCEQVYAVLLSTNNSYSQLVLFSSNQNR